MAKKNEPFKFEKYNSRSKRVTSLSKPDTIYAKAWFSTSAVFAFVLIDFFWLYNKWNMVQTAGFGYLCAIAFASAAALDVPLAVAAVQMKRYKQGLCGSGEKNLVMGISIIVFGIAFVSNFVFGIVTRNAVFSEANTNVLVNAADTVGQLTETGAAEESAMVLYAALVSGLIPLLTSLSSFVISYFSYDPLGMKIAKLEKERIGLQENILDTEKALSESESVEEYLHELTEREEHLFSDFTEKLDSEGMAMAQIVRMLVMEKMKTAKEVTVVFRNGEKVMEKHQEESLLQNAAEKMEETQKEIADEVLEEQEKILQEDEETSELEKIENKVA